MADDAPPIKTEAPASAPSTQPEQERTLISSLTERLRFFFSDANLRQDKWMRTQLDENGGCLSLDALLRFHTIKSISTDKALLVRAAQGEDAYEGDDLKKLIAYDEAKGTVARVVPFDAATMGDGSKLSLYVKRVPLTTEEDDAAVKKEEDAAVKKEEAEEEKKKEPFKPRYAVTRDEVKALFEPYGRVGIVQLRYGRRQPAVSGENEKYTSPSHRGHGRGEAYPLGVAIVEFETMEGMEKACAALLPPKAENGDGDAKDEAKKEPSTVLELKGHTLVIEKMRPSKRFQDSPTKRSRDGGDDANGEGGNEATKVEFEPITMEWEKGCVIALAGLSTTKCDRESIRDAVSDPLGVPNDVKASGLYVDYNRGESKGNLRLKEPKPDEMKALVDKLNDGTVQIAGEKVGSAKVLEGEEEEQYWKDFTAFLNNRKRMREEEKAQSRKRQRHGGGRRGRGGGRR